MYYLKYSVFTKKYRFNLKRYRHQYGGNGFYQVVNKHNCWC